MIPLSPSSGTGRSGWRVATHAYPCLGVSDNIRKSLRGDGEQPNRLIGRVREVVQPVLAFGEVHDISGRKLLFALWSANGRCTGEDEKHLLHAVVHVQRTSRRAWQKLAQRGSEDVRSKRVPEPTDAHPIVVAHLIPGFVGQEVQAVHGSSVSSRRRCKEIILACANASLTRGYVYRMKTFNLNSDEWDGTRDREGWRAKGALVGQHIGGELIGATMSEVEPGDKLWPYHTHYLNEEWVIVLRGEPTLRTPEGEHVLSEGDVVCFPQGKDGAHQIINRTDSPIRVLMLSSMIRGEIIEYLDTGKVLAKGVEDEDIMFARPGPEADYWEGEEELSSSG